MVLVCANSWNTLPVPVVSRTILHIIQASTAEIETGTPTNGVAQAHSEQGKLEVSSDI